MFLATPNSPTVPEYIANSREAADYFSSYIRRNASKKIEQKDLEKLLLKTLHTLAVGKNKDRAYIHPGSGNKSVDSGTLTYQLRDGLERRYWHFELITNHKLSPGHEREVGTLEAIRGYLKKNPGDYNIKYSELPNGGQSTYYSPKYEGLDNWNEQDWPLHPIISIDVKFTRKNNLQEVQVKDSMMEFIYPKVEDLFLMKTRMTEELDTLLSLVNVTRNGITTNEPEQIVIHAAKYLQLIVASHTLERMNLSTAMIHVNTFLQIAGHKPVYHRNLDGVACGLNTADFVDFFKKYISNPANQVN